MNIIWNIDKKRGNFRPTLHYTITLEEHEQALAMESLRIESTIPRIPNPARAWCLPNEDERSENWRATEFHFLTVPWFKTGGDSGFFRLPFRSSCAYPEVEESFLDLRQCYEKVVRAAYRWHPIKECGELTTSQKTKEAIAARLAAMQMIQLGEV